MQQYFLEIIKKPINMPLNLEEVKTYLKIDHDIEDDLLMDFTKCVVEKFESYTEMLLMKQVCSVTYSNICGSLVILPVKTTNKIISVSIDKEPIIDAGFKLLERNKLDLGHIIHCDILNIVFEAGVAEFGNQISSHLKILLLQHIAHLYENRVPSADFLMHKYDSFKTFII